MLEELLKQLPIGDIAKQVGATKPQTKTAVEAALPALLGGMVANAQNGGGASLLEALQQHGSSLFDGGVNVADVDTADGEKIVKNVFGKEKDAVVAKLGSTGGGVDLGDLIGKVMPILAPIVLSFLAAKLFGGGNQTIAPKQNDNAGGFDLGGLLGGLLGGGNQQQSSGGGFDLGGLLGGLLGGGNSAPATTSKSKKKVQEPSGGLDLDLGGLLGGLLGGGKK